MRSPLNTWALVLQVQASGGPALLRALCQTPGCSWDRAAAGPRGSVLRTGSLLQRGHLGLPGTGNVTDATEQLSF